MNSAIYQKLILVDDYDSLKELLRKRLIECGWSDQIKIICKELVKEHCKGDLNFNTLLSLVTPRAKNLVPDSVKKELLQKIKNQLVDQEEKLKIT